MGFGLWEHGVLAVGGGGAASWVLKEGLTMI